MFTYNPTVLSGFQVLSSTDRDGYTVHDVQYESPHGGHVPAYLVIPDTKETCPAIIFMHPGQGSRASFLPEAEALAAKGVVSLLINAPFLRGGKAPNHLSPEQKLKSAIEITLNTKQFIQTVVDIRRGVDFLSEHSGVDPDRIAYVGHSYGATWGGVLAGVEKRIKAYVLMAGFSRLSAWHEGSEHPLAALVRNFAPPERFSTFLTEVEPMNAVHYVGNAAPASILFQFASQDEFVSEEQAETFYTAASSPKEIIWYDADHFFTDCRAAYEERTRWICQQLQLKNENN